jgi:hypothetical protein
MTLIFEHLLFLRKGMWIGASDEATEGAWKWLDETRLDLSTYWANGEPNGGTRENCAMTNWPSTGKWNDAHCAHEYIFLCQMHNGEIWKELGETKRM